MRPESPAFLWDARRAANLIQHLVHGYASIDNEIVWEVATTRVSGLIDRLDRLLDGAGGAGHD